MGITPAHAGKSEAAELAEKIRKDHPRTRGEKCQTFCIVLCAEGSPPHTRGKVMGKLILKNGDGITPAHAGKRDAKTVTSVEK